MSQTEEQRVATKVWRGKDVIWERRAVSRNIPQMIQCTSWLLKKTVKICQRRLGVLTYTYNSVGDGDGKIEVWGQPGQKC